MELKIKVIKVPYYGIKFNKMLNINNILSEYHFYEAPSELLRPIEKVISGFLPIFRSIELQNNFNIECNGLLSVDRAALVQAIQLMPHRKTPKYLLQSDRLFPRMDECEDYLSTIFGRALYKCS